MKNKTLIIAFIAICVFSINGNANAETVVPTTSNTCLSFTKNLRPGTKDLSINSEIKKLQKFLINAKYLNTEATGTYGTLTQNAVKNFQSSQNLPSTGLVGSLTRQKIKDITCKTTNVATPETPVVTMPIAPVENTVKSTTLPHNSGNFSLWEANWGKTEFNTDGIFTLKASPETNGGQISLKNSNELKDYTVTIDSQVKQGTITIIVRYVNDDNFLACNFSGRYIEIVQKVNGQSSVVAYTSVAEYPYATFFNENTNLGVSVNGNTIGCTLVGNEFNISFNKVDSKLSKGGVAIQTWVNAKGISEINIRKISVK